ncbi:hypothetical protein SCB71_16715 [Herbiconiux sp. KACC 21604]|uniref:hypothetical protein n=1 Tax=unclassified Herbiconiux TaxID=2618217 RepID=UPI0020A4C643|nr:hypothetical protein [Herbiconiux sp. SALV-R1]WPO85846.1 hypothetical protein SCB71_16715 [Herbiconiux sp. KACC 21604]
MSAITTATSTAPGPVRNRQPLLPPSAPPADDPHLLITRDPRHGVTLYAQQIADALAGPTGHLTKELDGSPTPAEDRVHLHFTDRLWGDDPASAAAAIERIAERATVTVTLHDLPQPSDGARGLPRRAAAYRRVVAAAAGVVCNSDHEVALLHSFVSASVEPAVIPLPVDPAPASPATTVGEAPVWLGGAGGSASDRAVGDRAVGDRHHHYRPPWPTVGVLGYIYPGKGHDRVLRAVGTLGRWPRPSVEALGRASEGHEHDLQNLRRHARYAGVALTVSGYLGDAELLARCRGTDVPVIAHAHVSASGSLGSWLSAGRRPVVLRSPYMEEMAELHRDSLTLVDPRELTGAIEHALLHPESTRLAPSALLGPSLAEVATRYRSFWAGVGW